MHNDLRRAWHLLPYARTRFTEPDIDAVVGVIERIDAEAQVQGELVAANLLEGAGILADLSALEAPDVVRVGEPFEIVVRTYGSTGCWIEAGVNLSVSALSANVIPYDRDLGAEDRSIFCPHDVIRLPRTVTLEFDEAGAATLILNGRRVIVGSDMGDDEMDLVVIEHRMTVLPAE